MKMQMLSVLLCTTLGGCMSYEEGRVGSLGQSVYATTYEQIADKELAANPGTEVSPVGTDGPLTEKVLDGYRGKTGDAQQIGQPIQINIGQ
ncbi:hypothetical protein F3I16_12050 [Pseudomonas sp. L-22-4S-12]|uniref:hypothetical protein n=1 Tax=Pseudomonas sp. L-22-4S-12 TaxID=2610893 RepID=UPI00132BC41A|nr:hypothetical protein [Pseudomonas sp. L-22-4S-12]MWV16773.1 hypothetical protein [Pseudomonas sp. L-22-4S-12]